MKCKMVYFSAGGTSRWTATFLGNEFLSDGHEIKWIDLCQSPYKEDSQTVLEALEGCDLVGFIGPAYHMNMAEPLLDLWSYLEKRRPIKPFSFKTFIVLLYGGITSGKALALGAERFEAMDITVVGLLKLKAPHFHKAVSFPSKLHEVQVQAFYQAMDDKHFEAIGKSEMTRLEASIKTKVKLLYPISYRSKDKSLSPVTH